MNHQDHVDLLRGAFAEQGERWADLGSGDGAFTLALRDLLGPDAEIFSVEKDGSRLEEQKRNFRNKFPNSNIHFMHADFTQSLNSSTSPFATLRVCELKTGLLVSSLDGIVMANALHFFRDKERVLRDLRGYLKPKGRLVLVEYNVDSGNMWVPHPISFNTFRALAPRAGFAEPKLLATKPSRFLRQIYSAVAMKS